MPAGSLPADVDGSNKRPWPLAIAAASADASRGPAAVLHAFSPYRLSTGAVAMRSLRRHRTSREKSCARSFLKFDRECRKSPGYCSSGQTPMCEPVVSSAWSLCSGLPQLGDVLPRSRVPTSGGKHSSVAHSHGRSFVWNVSRRSRRTCYSAGKAATGKASSFVDS